MTNSLMNENWMNHRESAEDILIRGGDVLTLSGLERGDVLTWQIGRASCRERV